MILRDYVAKIRDTVRRTRTIPATLYRDSYRFRIMVSIVRELAIRFKMLEAVKKEIPWLMS